MKVTENLKLYGIWANMKTRCLNPKNKDFKHYGGRGIIICENWKNSNKFINWALKNGYKDGLSLERKDNDKGYNPSNCIFIDRLYQPKNRRTNFLISHLGETKTLAEWSRITGINARTIKSRIDTGFSFFEALTNKKFTLRTSEILIFEGEKYTKSQLALKFNLSKRMFHYYYNKGLSLAEIKNLKNNNN